MHPLPPGSFRACALAVLLGTGLLALDHGRAAGPATDDAAAQPLEPNATSLKATSRLGPHNEAERCLVSVAYPEGLPRPRRVTLTDVVSDRECPSELNATQELSFEVETKASTGSLWWRRSPASFDVLHPSSGPIGASGKSRVTVSDLILDDAVTIDVMDGDQKVLSFTIRHF